MATVAEVGAVATGAEAGAVATGTEVGAAAEVVANLRSRFRYVDEADLIKRGVSPKKCLASESGRRIAPSRPIGVSFFIVVAIGVEGLRVRLALV